MSSITTDPNLAVQNLQAGKPVAIPTETVYGLAALFDQEEAIRAVFTLKQRPLNHPLIVHVGEGWDLSPWIDSMPDYARSLIEHFWPGPLTLVCSATQGQISSLVTGGQTTVALRCPAHPLAQELLQQLRKPLVAPSANLFGKISPTTAEHVKDSLMDQDLLILDGGRCRVGIESTIIDVTRADAYSILRPGVLTEKALSVWSGVSCTSALHAIRVPGALNSHYQPQKKLYYFENAYSLAEFCTLNPRSVYVLAPSKPQDLDSAYFYPLASSPQQVAHELYYQLRQADASDARYIAIALPPATSEWQGVCERILKAGLNYTHD